MRPPSPVTPRIAVARSGQVQRTADVSLVETGPVTASLVSRRVTDDAALPAVAFTSDHSRPGFERMGFLPFTRFTLWTRRIVA